jgi:hypothetical protein
MGYCGEAPNDDNVGDPDFTKDIIMNYLTSGWPDEVKRWMYANRDKEIASFPDVKNGLGPTNPKGRGWNACVIDMRGTGEYWFWDAKILDAQGYPTLRMIPKANW